MHFHRQLPFVGGIVASVLLSAPATAGGPNISTVRVASGLGNPLFATHAPGDYNRLFIVEQYEADIEILNLNTGMVNGTEFLDINSRVTNGGNERGLLGLAFHPNYPTNGLFYVHYNDNNGDTVIAEYSVTGDPEIADFNSERIVLTQSQPQTNHNGGWIGFSPIDGFLYIGLGDGGFFCDTGTGHTSGIGNAQDITNNLLGKMLRIDPVTTSGYLIPASNPFVGVTGDDEIWAYGLRNPWRSSFDRLTGDLYIGDVGQDLREEVNFQRVVSSGGENYGWRCEEGFACSTTSPSSCGSTTGCNCPAGTPGLTSPIHDYPHPGAGVCSVVGGYVYRGCAIPELDGTYFFSDFCSNQFWSFEVVGGVSTNFTDRTSEITNTDVGAVNSIVSFGEDAFGEIYLVGGGEVFKIVSDDPITDCNGNGRADACDILAGSSTDNNGNGLPDECEPVVNKRPSGTSPQRP